MTVDPNILLFVITVAALVIILAVGAAAGWLSGGNKESKQRLSKIKARYTESGPAVQTNTSIRKNQAATGLLGALDGLVPRRDELDKRLKRAGLTVTLGKFAMIMLGFAAFMMLALLAIGTPLMLSVTGGLSLGFGLPLMVVNSMVKRRISAFTKQFPDAIDMMVRGLKSGLPVSECIQNVGQEMAAPTGLEFATVTDQMRLGTTLEDALWDTADRLDTPDFKFFVISLSVQRETGGNLGETLSNLSAILRSRQAMKLKVNALSSEAKASAWIVGLLPFIMLGLIMMVNPGYGIVLFTNPQATAILIGAGIWMAFGIFIMARMTSFEI